MKINPDFKKVALQAVRAAGKILEKNFKKNYKVSFKKDLSLISDIDLKVEQLIIKLIKDNFPSHNILSEESGGKIGKEYTWIIDALDGTTNYTKKFPFFSVSLALLYNKKPVLGVVFNPLSKELFFAENGMGSFLNGRRIRISSQKDLVRSVILVSKGMRKEDFIGFHKMLGKLGKICGMFRKWGSASLELCYVATGRTDGFIDVGSKLWDLAAGFLIVKEAEGIVTNFKGEGWQINTKSTIAANKKIHKRLLKLTK